MKKINLLFFALFAIFFSVKAQTPYNPFLHNIHFAPEPTAAGFACGSLNNLTLTQGLTTIDSATDWQNNPLKIKISIEGFLFALPANQTVTGSYAVNFNWEIDSIDPGIIIGTQKQTIHGTGNDPLFPDPLSSGDIIVALIANANNPQGTILKVVANLILPAYMMPFNSVGDDLESSQTQTFFTGTTLTSAGSITGSKVYCVSGDPQAFPSLAPASGPIGGNYFYQWQEKINDVWIDIPGATNLTFNAPATSSDKYYRRRAKGTVCDNWVSTDSVTIKIDSLPIVGIVAGGNASLNCVNSTKILGLPAKAGYKYKWLPTSGLSSDTVAQPTASPLISTTYTLMVTDSNQCSATDTSRIVVTNTAVPVDAGVDKFLDCKILSALIGPTTSTGNTYSWLPTTGLSSASVAQPSANPTATTSYSLTVTNIDGCKSYDTVVVFVDRITPFADAGIDRVICAGDSIQIGTPLVLGSTYLWSPVAGLSNATIAQPNASPSITTTYTVVVTGSNGCTASDVAIVQRNICTIDISGTVYHDSTGLSNSKVDGLGIFNPNGVQLFANLADSNNIIIRTIAIGMNGLYKFNNITTNQNYRMILSLTQGVVGSLAPLPLLPSGWINIGEDCCDKSGDDGLINGINLISVAESNVPNIDFGIKPGFPLPLVLKEFYINEFNCSSLLSFTTSSEINTLHVEILRKDKLQTSFRKMATILGSNQSTNSKLYSYIDHDVTADIVYEYQLKFVDVDERFTLSDVKSIKLNCEQKQASVNIYPNPASDLLNVLCVVEMDKTSMEFEVVDITGRAVYTTTKEAASGANLFQIDLNHLAKGSYIMRYRNDNDLMNGSIQFVKQ
jgi:hypothetical protein